MLQLKKSPLVCFIFFQKTNVLLILHKNHLFTKTINSVQLAGSCVGCPSSSVTLKNGVENMLMHYIPEVTGVESIEEETEDNGKEVVVEQTETEKKNKSYEERLAAAGIPFSD
uniref:NIF system FeS cluster assembly NifU C-terminal domain-containing protein n=1 Tax=Ditylum brightwellii TaxID=49249 RepID=A0A7S4SGG7_9STRA